MKNAEFIPWKTLAKRVYASSVGVGAYDDPFTDTNFVFLKDF